MLTEINIKPENLWHFNKTGLRIGIGGNEFVTTTDKRCRAWLGSDTQRKLITSVECQRCWRLYCTNGQVHQERWYDLTDIDDDTLIGLSDTGYMNDSLARE